MELDRALFSLLRYLATDAVYPKMNATGHLDLATYPKTISDAHTLIRYANELLCTVPIAAGEPWAAVLRRMTDALVPPSLIQHSELLVVVLCFDTPLPHAMRIEHPLNTTQARIVAQRAGTPWKLNGDIQSQFDGTVQSGTCMLHIFADPVACTAFYAALLNAMAEHATLTANVRIVLDGLIDTGAPYVITLDAGGRVLCRADNTRLSGFALTRWPDGARDALDCVGLWTELAWGHGPVVVEYGAGEALLKLMARAELRLIEGAALPKLWYVHRRSGGICVQATDDVSVPQTTISEPHEYIDVCAATARLHTAYGYGFAPLYVGGAEGQQAPLVMPIIALLLLVLFHKERMSLKVLSCSAACATLLRTARYCAQMISTSFAGAPGPMAALTIGVHTAPFGRLYSAVALCQDYHTPPMESAAARGALALHRLYNGHLPGQRIDDAAVTAMADERRSRWGYERRPDTGRFVMAHWTERRSVYCFAQEQQVK